MLEYGKISLKSSGVSTSTRGYFACLGVFLKIKPFFFFNETSVFMGYSITSKTIKNYKLCTQRY